ncbi:MULTISPECIES: hypothetical protein [Pseudonocardia]|uniref:hypothetical protein n=1 Tax=Pseudonocardia TaxID=1847 RepID=UPI000F7A6F5F|nr:MULTISPECIES: hypothetical protein [Pseudonocardia]
MNRRWPDERAAGSDTPDDPGVSPECRPAIPEQAWPAGDTDPAAELLEAWARFRRGPGRFA